MPSFARLPFVLAATIAFASAQVPEPAPAPPADPVATGRQQALAHEWPAAIATLSAVLAKTPDDVEALRWRGHAFTGAERFAEALVDLDRALALGAADAWTNYGRAMALQHLGRLEEALAGYSRALEIDAEFFKAYEWRGFTRSRLGDHVGALADLDRALAQDPGNTWLYVIRGKCHVALHDLRRAEEDFWVVVDRDGNHADAHAQLGYLKACLGEAKAARGFLQRAVALDGEGQIEARLWVYELAVDAGDAEGARAQLEVIEDPAKATAKERRWPRRLAAFVAGRLELPALLAAATDEAESPAEVPARRCAALWHAGCAAARAGRQEAALGLLGRALAEDAMDQWEWAAARRRLRELAGK